jgi:hypothetical protein
MPISFAQAEKLAGEYVHRSEELLKGAGAFLKDAVHVIPAEGSGDTRGVVWDGSDMYANQFVRCGCSCTNSNHLDG